MLGVPRNRQASPCRMTCRMTRVRRRAATTILMLLLGVAGCRETPRRPVNILLITIDTFRADRLGSATPTLGRLGREGVRFDAADSPVPLTLPAHASLMSGLW